MNETTGLLYSIPFRAGLIKFSNLLDVCVDIHAQMEAQVRVKLCDLRGI